jgi:hypothetical protein
MIKFTNVCQYCGEEFVDEEHNCEGMKAAQKAAEAAGAMMASMSADLGKMFNEIDTAICATVVKKADIDTWDYVVADIRLRNEMGRKKYGVTLKPSTNEDLLQHAYEEALDLTVYLKTEILKRKFASPIYQD